MLTWNQYLKLLHFKYKIPLNFKTATTRRKFHISIKMSADVQEATWRGVPITEMYGSQSPWGAPEFPLVVPGHTHTVLYHIPSGGRSFEDGPPKPRTGYDVWNNSFVRMPCSSQSLYPIDDNNGETHLRKRWEIIEEALSKPIRNSGELAKAILSYNSKFSTIWKFTALHKLFNQYVDEDESKYFFDVTLPEIIKLALALPKLIQSRIPLLEQSKNMSVSLSQQQIASLMANAFFCTFPRRNTSKKSVEYANYPHINFSRLFNSSGSESVLEKLKCICHYFRRVCTKVPVGVVTYWRRAAAAGTTPRWDASTRGLAGLPLHVDCDTTIEDAHGLIQVDFANKFLGGGVLNFGCVQEEIRFVICPELMISMLLAEVLEPNEAVMIIGCERYSTYSGYGSSFSWTGDFKDSTPYDSSGRRRCAVLAIDALPYPSIQKEHQPKMILRELNKAWVGVSFGIDSESDGIQYPGVATGNWGCGAFGGSPHLKSLIQIMACAQVRRPMAYFTFGDVQLRDDIIDIYNVLAKYNVTVGQLYEHLVNFTYTDIKRGLLHSFLIRKIQNKSKLCPSVAPNLKFNKPKSPAEETELDTSDIAMDVSEGEISKHIASNNTQDSPDLFSQDEFDKEIGTELNDLMDAAEKGELPHDNRKLDDQATPNDDGKSVKEHTSRLFDEMQKFDEQNGRLNFSTPIKSPLKQSSSKLDQSDAVMDEEKIRLDVSPEVKKKMSKKITDYFSKKSI